MIKYGKFFKVQGNIVPNIVGISSTTPNNQGAYVTTLISIGAKKSLFLILFSERFGGCEKVGTLINNILYDVETKYVTPEMTKYLAGRM